MDLNRYYADVQEHLEEINSQILILDSSSKKGRSKDELQQHLEDVSVLLADVGVCIFELRYLSWGVYQEYRRGGEPALMQFSYQKLRDEIKDNVYALIQMSQALQERSRSVRAMYMSY